jgi:hypothetical protein
LASPNANPQPKQIITRFLFPFLFEREKAANVAEQLLCATVPGRDGTPVSLWECCDAPPLYREELLHNVDDFLFGGSARGCKYLRVTSALCNKWLSDLRAVLIPERPEFSPHRHSVPVLQQDSLACDVTVAPLAGIEMFLTNYGVGLLSIALTTREAPADAETGILFNYKLAQSRPKVAATLHKNHPSDDGERWKILSDDQKAMVPAAPALDSPLNERIGVAGSQFQLWELATEVLLAPLNKWKFKSFQDQFSVFTCVRFDDRVDFNNPETIKLLTPFLSALTQVEEPGHAGALDENLKLANQILNRRHWTAVGLLGMAHIVSDQPHEHDFNQQRVPRVIMKYFVPYLAGMLQRVSLQRSLREASEFVLHKKTDTEAGMSKLRKQLLEFALEGYFSEISHREVLDRYYRMLREGLGVSRSYQAITDSIADLNAQFAADHQARLSEQMAENVASARALQEETAKVQRKIALLERFIVSVYAAELWHLVASEVDRLHPFVPYGVIVFAILGFVGAWLLERRGKKQR